MPVGTHAHLLVFWPSDLPGIHMSLRELPSPQEPEGRKGRPNSVTRGEYLGNDNWLHINEKYQLHDPNSLTSGRRCQNPTKWRLRSANNPTGRTLSPSWKGDLRQSGRPGSQKAEKESGSAEVTEDPKRLKVQIEGTAPKPGLNCVSLTSNAGS